MAAAISADDAARELLRGGDGGRRHARCAAVARGDAVRDATRAFFERVEHRALSYEIGERAAGEMPEMLVKAIRAAVGGKFETARRRHVGAERDDPRAPCRPSTARASTSCSSEARVINRLRDERGMYADCWAIGHRAPRRCSRRGGGCASARLLAAAEHAVDATSRRARRTLLAGGARPSSADEIASARDVAHDQDGRRLPAVPRRSAGAPPPDVAILARAGAARGARDRCGARQPVQGVDPELDAEGRARPVASTTASTRASRAVIDGLRSSSGSSRATCSSPASPRPTSTSCCRCSARSSPIAAASSATRRSSRASTAFPAIVGTKEATTIIPDGARVRVDGGYGRGHDPVRRMIVDCIEAGDEEDRYGGKAVQLGARCAPACPVPRASRLDWQHGASAGGRRAVERRAAPRRQHRRSARGVAVRSSAIGEDSALASFAGQHATVLGVRTRARSARSDRARPRLGAAPRPRSPIARSSASTPSRAWASWSSR